MNIPWYTVAVIAHAEAAIRAARAADETAKAFAGLRLASERAIESGEAFLAAADPGSTPGPDDSRVSSPAPRPLRVIHLAPPDEP